MQVKYSLTTNCGNNRYSKMLNEAKIEGIKNLELGEPHVVIQLIRMHQRLMIVQWK